MKIVLADQKHDQALRDLARNTPAPGWVRLSFCREPDFFHGLSVQGYCGQVIAAMDGPSLVGMGCRTVRMVYVNGRKSPMGYLSGLRILPAARRTILLARGYQFLKTLHDHDAHVPAYLTTIVEDNTQAASLLTSRRAGLPHYLDHGRYITYAIDTHRPRRSLSGRTPALRRGGEMPLGDIVAFLDREGAKKQFFPALTASDFVGNQLRGLGIDDFLVSYDDSGITGVLAGWDQSAFKQHTVIGYTPIVSSIRPFVNLLRRAIGGHSLPAPGEDLNVVHASFVCVRDNDPSILVGLLDALCQSQPAKRHFALVGLHERDPLNPAMSSFRTIRYESRLYLTCWDDGLAFTGALDASRIPHLELSTL